MTDARSILAEAADRAGVSLKGLSEEAGLNHAYLQQFVKRGVPRKLPEDVRRFVAQRLGISEIDLGALPAVATKTERAPASLPSPNASPPIPVTFPNVTIGMYGAVAGGAPDNGKFILNGNRLMDVLCPPMLIGVQGAYGVFIHGNSMKPRYREGEAVFVNPHLPIRQEDYAVVQIAGEFEGDTSSGFVKQFISRNANELVMAQHQPPETEEAESYSEGRFLLRFPRSKVIAVHRIVWAGEV